MKFCASQCTKTHQQHPSLSAVTMIHLGQVSFAPGSIPAADSAPLAPTKIPQ